MFNGSETIFLLIFPYFFHVEISLYPNSSLTPAARGPALAGLLDFFFVNVMADILSLLL